MANVADILNGVKLTPFTCIVLALLCLGGAAASNYMQLGGEYTLAAGGAAVALFGLGIANAQSELKNIATDNAAKLDALNAQIEKTKACVKPDGAAICQYEKPLSEVLA